MILKILEDYIKIYIFNSKKLSQEYIEFWLPSLFYEYKLQCYMKNLLNHFYLVTPSAPPSPDTNLIITHPFGF